MEELQGALIQLAQLVGQAGQEEVFHIKARALLGVLTAALRAVRILVAKQIEWEQGQAGDKALEN